MSIKIPKALIFTIAFVVTLVLYWPAMNGTPIWDDYTFWFNDPVINEHTSYFTVWRDYSWPVSVTFQKLLFNWWGKDYFYYHLFNVTLHFINALLVYKLGRLIRIKYPVIFFLLFLLHPAAVITTAWMVQLKTLLCFFFGLASLLMYLQGNKNTKWMVVSWIFFFLSVASKSASLTLPVILFFIHLRLNGFKRIYLLIPFFIFSGWNAYMILKSSVTTEGSEKASTITKLKEGPSVTEETLGPTKEPTPEPEKPVIVKKAEPAPKPEETISIPVPAEPKEVEATIEVQPLPEMPAPSVPEVKTTLNFIGLNLELVSQTMYYYFWQVVMPMRNEPVKGLNYQRPGFEEFMHVFFLLILVFIFWKDSGLIYLGAGHFLLLPFLGFIPAPYMNITWVSDQHLYLVLPALLAFWMRVIDKIEWKYSYLIPSLFLIFFSYKTLRATPMYETQTIFYEKSLEYNPYNVPLAYNLGYSYLMKGEWPLAYNVISDAYNLAQKEPLVRNNVYFPHLAYLYFMMKNSLEKNEN